MKLINKLKEIKYSLAVKKHEYEYLYGFLRRWNKFHATEFHSREKKYLRLRILVETHILEKGFSHNVFKPGFGEKTVVNLYKHIKQYEQFDDIDRSAISTAYMRLQTYHELNKKYGYDDSRFLPCLSVLSNQNDGIKKIVLKNHNNGFDFTDFAKNRVSIRLYDQRSEAIGREEISECIAVGQLSPSACNRQAVRVHVTFDENHIDEFEKIHGGCNGFGHNAGALVVVTSDLELFEGSEIRLPSIDAGLFMMSFVYACQEKNIYSCILNGAFPGDANGKIRTLLGIPSNEDIEGCIVLYKVSEDIEVKVPESRRKPVNEICTFIN